MTAAISYVGVAVALLTLPQPLNIGISLLLFLVERTLNRVIFRLPTVFVPQPIARTLSDIGFDHLAVATVSHPPGHPSILFLGFSSCDAATELFTTLAAWCGRSVEERMIDDRDPGRIGLSVVFEDTQTYRVFLYRALTAPAGHLEVETEDEEADEIEEIVQVNLVRTRLFPVVGSWPAVYQAQSVFGDGQEYILAAARVENGAVTRCEGLPSFRKRGFRVRSRFQITRAMDPMEFATYLTLERESSAGPS